MENDSKYNIYSALIRAKQKFKPVLKETINPVHKSKYAQLSEYLNATEEALLEENLFIIQKFRKENNELILDTIICHSLSTDKIVSSMTIPTTKIYKDIQIEKTDQEIGSTITYYRRYSYAAILNLSAEDDDGNESIKKDLPIESKKQEPKKAETEKKKTLSEKLLDCKSLEEISEVENTFKKYCKENNKSDIYYSSNIDLIEKSRLELIAKQKGEKIDKTN
jgi:hypothetical protein